MKKILSVLIFILVISGTVFAASYNIDEHTDVELSGISKVVFELKHPACAICISTGKQTYSVIGGGRRGTLSLSLEGDLKSNNKKAVPSLNIDDSGDTLTIRLYKETSLFFGLVKSGSVHFNAVLPDYFDGDIEVISSSGDTSASGINAKSVLVKSSSGDVDASGIEAGIISLEASSGRISASSLAAVDNLYIRSSSGDINLDELLSEEATVKASSGRIDIGRIRTTGNLSVHASSGRINADYLEGDSVSVDSSSGRINVEGLKSNKTYFDASSGDINISDMIGGSTDIKASSGRITAAVTELTGDINVKSSSGDVNIQLPQGTGFSADLSASSGKIRSTFRLLGEITGNRKNEVIGDANGGGFRIGIKASSGNITIEER